jgi:hypothetical protein
MTVISLLPVGVPDIEPKERGRKDFQEIFYNEKYGNPLKI